MPETAITARQMHRTFAFRRMRVASPGAHRHVPNTPWALALASLLFAAISAFAADDDLPLGKDALFGIDDARTPRADDTAPASKDALFGDTGQDPSDAGEARSGSRKAALRFRGFVENTTAYTYAPPGHWSTAVVRTQVGTSGQAGPNLKWKATLRLDVDPVYQWSDFYPDAVRRDQRAELLIRETYVDTSIKGWDLRLGRQQIVWGEMVGLFFADVVSARDLRQFVLPSFDVVRTPQWAARGEYFLEDAHLELIWIPYTTVDNIGQPGAEFYPIQTPAPQGFAQVFNNQVMPGRSLGDSNYGARVSALRAGWDMSLFYYRSTDAQVTFYRDVSIAPIPTVTWTPRHERIWQVGGTTSKDLGKVMFKAEAIYTDGRKFNVTRLDAPGGVVGQNTFDWVVGLDYTLPAETRLNVQLFQRIYFDHDPDLIFDRHENGASVLLSGRLGQKWNPELLWIQSLNRNEYLLRPRMIWRPEPNLRVAFGVDAFGGPPTGVFGRFADRDRAYVETRYDF
jgi:hypothetical protein